MARLARLQSRTAVGLVFGRWRRARLAHLGMLQALQERGIEIDCVGGTSIGAVMAALVAADQPLDAGHRHCAPGLCAEPHRRLQPAARDLADRGPAPAHAHRQGAANELLGADADIEDLWKTYFCVATNYSQAREHRFAAATCAQALLASIAIPGALPPVVRDGDLLCDGGTFNNFPVDVMRAMRGVGKVIGVDLGARQPRRLEFDEVPGSWALLRDRLRPRRSGATGCRR